MRDDRTEFRTVPGAGGESPTKKTKVGRSRISWMNPRLIGLFVVGAAVLPLLRIQERVPESIPMRLAQGNRDVQTVAFAFSPRGDTIVAGLSDGRVALRDEDGGWANQRFLTVSDHNWALTFSPDGRFLALGGEGPDIVFCDPRYMVQERRLGMPIRGTRALAFSPDGRSLAASGSLSSEIILWDLDRGRSGMILRGHSSAPLSLAFAPDGRSLASAGNSDRTIIIWDLTSGTPRRRLVGQPGPVISVVFSPDGSSLASACVYENAVRLWDVGTGRLVRLLEGQPPSFSSVAYSPNGRLLATAGTAGTVSLWSVATGRRIKDLDAHASWLDTVAFSPDGRTLAAVGSDDDIRLWDLTDLLKTEPEPRRGRVGGHTDFGDERALECQ